MLKKYLYLREWEWQQAWLDGGSIPINLASSYLSPERLGILTPDENFVYNSPIDLRRTPGIRIAGMGGHRNITIEGCSWNGLKMPDVSEVSMYVEDGNILSFCNVAHNGIRRRMHKACCVEIVDVNALKEIIDEQLGLVGQMGPCEYTDGHQRNHFLKSTEDSWQQEYRMFWPGKENKRVTLPAGIAVPVKF